MDEPTVEEPLLAVRRGGDGEDGAMASTAAEVKRLLRLAGPLMAGFVLRNSVQMVSVMFVGHLGELQLAGSSLAASLANVTGFSFLFGMSSALDTLCGQAYGAGQHRLLGVYAQRAMLVLAAAAVPIALVWASAGEILLLFGQDPAIAAEAGAYARWMIPSLAAYVPLACALRFLQAQGIVVPVMASSGVAAVAHVAVCWALVHKAGMGSKGAALSGAVTYWTNFAVLAFYARLSGACKATWTGFSMDAFRELRRFTELAVPSAMMVCLEWSSFEILVLLSGILPNPQLETAVLSISLSTASLLIMVPRGIGSSLSTRVSNELGGGHPRAARMAARVATAMTVLVCLVLVIAMILLRNVWGYTYSSEEEVVAYIASMLPILAVSFFVDGINGALSGVLTGCGKQKIGAHVNLGAFYLVGIPTAVLLAFVLHLNGEGLWLGIVCGSISKVGMLLFITLHTDWGKEVQKASPCKHFGLYHVIMAKERAGMGSKGAALSGAVTYWTNLAVLALYVRLSGACDTTWTGFSIDAFRELRRFTELAVPSAMMVCLEWWSFEILVLLSGILPNPQLETSVLSICLSTSSLLFMVPRGIGSSLSTRVSNELGGGHPRAARMAARVTIAMTVLVCLVLVIAMIFLRNVWGNASSSEEEVVAYIASMLPVLAVSFFIDGINGALSGCGKQNIGAHVNLAAFYLVGIPTAVLLAFVLHLNGEGLWLGLVCGSISKVGMLLFITLRYHGKRKGLQFKSSNSMKNSRNVGVVFSNEDVFNVIGAMCAATWKSERRTRQGPTPYAHRGDKSMLKRLIHGFYAAAIVRLPVDEMPALLPAILDSNLYFGPLDPISNIVTNVVSRLPPAANVMASAVAESPCGVLDQLLPLHAHPRGVALPARHRGGSCHRPPHRGRLLHAHIRRRLGHYQDHPPLHYGGPRATPTWTALPWPCLHHCRNSG
uniref:Protein DETOXIFICATION n=1 Tax=Oryza glumipatula TaxID=40148 RepID=A0A0E0B992_9ORYZ